MKLWRMLVGPPLRVSEAEREQIGAVGGLAALSLDALTSVAYGPEAIVVVLATAGTAALPLIVPITVAIVLLLSILVFSYRQVIEAYPAGGGAYAVSRANLGPGASRLAGASLIIDYILTVAVSIAAGVGALTSAFPALLPATTPLCIGVLAVITVLNLRGVGESARAFLLPTMLFIVGILGIVVVGLIHPMHTPVTGAPVSGSGIGLTLVGILLVLKAFAAGCSALTGVEAIANGVPLFRAPSVARAKQTELLLGLLLGIMLLGLAVLTARFHIGPHAGQTVLSQIMTAAVGRGWFYYMVSITTTVVLALAANTSFGGLPVLLSRLAQDHLMPHIFTVRGERLVFQYGIGALALLSGLLLAVVRGDTNALIPLFAIGVFIGFTLSQTGLVVHWWRTRPRHWRSRAILNGTGALATAAATLIFLFAKFLEGAWVVVVAVPLLMLLFRRIHMYYQHVGEQLALGTRPPPLVRRPTLVVVPVTGVSKLTAQALSDAVSLGDDVVAVSVQVGEQARSDLEDEWKRWNPGVPLVTLQTEYHSVTRPFLRYIRSLEHSEQDRIIVLIPEILPAHFWQRMLHNQRGVILAAALQQHSNVVVGRLAFHLHGEV